MQVKIRSRRVLLAALGVLVGVTACGKKETPPPPAETAAPAPPPPPPPQPKVSGIELGRQIAADGRVLAAITSFGQRDTIYVSITSENTPPGALLSARWTYQTGQLVDSSSQAIAAPSLAITEFHIVKRSPWPAGKYKVEVLLNGAPVGSRDFEVAK